MILGPDYVFIAVPRTASVSIASWLVAEHGGIWHGDHHGTDIPLEHRDKFTFTVVRDPFTRLPSMYRYVAEKFWPDTCWRESAEAADWRALGMPFDCGMAEFIRWAAAQRGHQWCSQWDMLDDPDGLEYLDRNLKFEELPGCLLSLPFVDKAKPLALPHLNPTGEYPSLTAEERAAISFHSSKDIRFWGYDIA